MLEDGHRHLRATCAACPHRSRGCERGREHTLTGTEITEKGAEIMAEYIMKVREVVGWEIPIPRISFGSMGVNSIIKLGKAFQKCNLAWMEDTVPWYHTDLLKQITQALEVPICTGEDMYLLRAPRGPVPGDAVDIIHPDLSSSGGILETKRIGDMAQRTGCRWPCIWPARRSAPSRTGAIAHRHGGLPGDGEPLGGYTLVDTLVDGVAKPVLNKASSSVPEGPGLGFTLNEEAVKQHLLEPGFFDRPRSVGQGAVAGQPVYLRFGGRRRGCPLIV